MNLWPSKTQSTKVNGQQGEASKRLFSKTRVQFDFTPEALQRLDEMKAKTGAATRAETIRNALRLYEWFITGAKPDSIVKIETGDHKVVSQFIARLLFS